MLRYNQKILKNYRTYCIYRIINPNNAVYIGATTNLKLRLKTYQENPNVYKNQTNLSKSIEKYGWHAHKVEILKEYTGDFDISTLNDIEQSYILKQYILNPDKTLNVVVKGISKEQMAAPRDI